jgi:hypothetical protein
MVTYEGSVAQDRMFKEIRKTQFMANYTITRNHTELQVLKETNHKKA